MRKVDANAARVLARMRRVFGGDGEVGFAGERQMHGGWQGEVAHVPYEGALHVSQGPLEYPSLAASEGWMRLLTFPVPSNWVWVGDTPRPEADRYTLCGRSGPEGLEWCFGNFFDDGVSEMAIPLGSFVQGEGATTWRRQRHAPAEPLLVWAGEERSRRHMLRDGKLLRNAGCVFVGLFGFCGRYKVGGARGRTIGQWSATAAEYSPLWGIWASITGRWLNVVALELVAQVGPMPTVQGVSVLGTPPGDMSLADVWLEEQFFSPPGALPSCVSAPGPGWMEQHSVFERPQGEAADEVRGERYRLALGAFVQDAGGVAWRQGMHGAPPPRVWAAETERFEHRWVLQEGEWRYLPYAEAEYGLEEPMCSPPQRVCYARIPYHYWYSTTTRAYGWCGLALEARGRMVRMSGPFRSGLSLERDAAGRTRLYERFGNEEVRLDLPGNGADDGDEDLDAGEDGSPALPGEQEAEDPGWEPDEPEPSPNPTLQDDEGVYYWFKAGDGVQVRERRTQNVAEVWFEIVTQAVGAVASVVLEGEVALSCAGGGDGNGGAVHWGFAEQGSAAVTALTDRTWTHGGWQANEQFPPTQSCVPVALATEAGGCVASVWVPVSSAALPESDDVLAYELTGEVVTRVIDRRRYRYRVVRVSLRRARLRAYVQQWLQAHATAAATVSPERLTGEISQPGALPPMVTATPALSLAAAGEAPAALSGQLGGMTYHVDAAAARVEVRGQSAWNKAEGGSVVRYSGQVAGVFTVRVG